MTQPDLFDAPVRARARDPRTSKQAAATVDRFAGGHYGEILLALREFGPMTVAGISVATKLAEQQINKRTPEMQRSGIIQTNGQTRPGPSGRQQRVWRAL